ncbi:hypothetical protein QW180_19845 [Vibrio sinaloensis]|nr:hypothetical protein [Vibrio sinaloensis]
MIKLADGGQIIDEYQQRFIQLINQDLNMPRALALLWEVLDSDYSSQDKKPRRCFFDQIFALDINHVEQEKKVPEDVMQLAQQRLAMKQQKKRFAEADKIREQINQLGYQVADKGDKFDVSAL